MKLGDKIVAACHETKGLTAAQAWAFATANGWKNPHGSGGGNGYLAWCAVAASLRVYRASGGAVTLAFGQPMKLALSRFRAGNASVPRISDDARRLGIATQTPTPGALVVVEVRKAGAEWAGKRSHIGIVTEVGNGTVKTLEGNYGGRDRALTRRLVPRDSDRERCLEFVDLDKYAAMVGMAPTEPAPVETDGDTDHDAGDVCGVDFDEGADVAALVDGYDEPQRCRVVGLDASGLPLLALCAPDGQVVMGVEPSAEWPIVGCWE